MNRTRLLWIMAPAAIGLAVFAVMHRPQPPARAIRTATVTRGTVSVTVTATGSIAATSSVDVRSRATGTVTQVFVLAGDHVTKGQLLATINDSDAQANAREAEAALAEKEGQVLQDRANVRQAEAKLATVLAGNRPEQIAQAQQSVNQYEANVTLYKASLAREQRLYRQGFVARSDVDQAQNQYDVAIAQLRSAQQNLQLQRAGSLASDIAASRAAVASAQGTLRDSEAQVTDAGAALQSAQERLSESQVRAPITGIVATRSIEVGQTLIGGTATSGASVFTLADVTPLLASVSVDETDIAKIRRGMAATVTADALPDAQFVGVVTRIAASGVVSNNVNQYTVVVQLTNPSAALKLGMTVDASFVVQAAHDTLLVPTEAIHSQGNMQFVTVVGSDGRLSARQVTTGISDDRNTAITTGLREGERVYLGQASGTPSRPATRNPFMPNMPRPSGSGSTGAR